MKQAENLADQSKQLHDFFIAWLDSEEKRKTLAESGQLALLKELYQEQAVHLPGMNSPLKWDFYSYRDFDQLDRVTATRIETVIDQVPNRATVLDYGCGYGYVLGQALARNREWDYTGIDFSEKFIKKLTEKYPNSSFLAGDLSLVPDNSFEVVLLLEVLEHIPSSQTLDFLTAVRSRLKPGGKLILSVPLYEDIAGSTCPCWFCGELGNPNGHVRSYTPALIRAELELSGYTVTASMDVFAKNRRLAIWKNRLKKLLAMEQSKAVNLVVVAR
jgi:2-polyprenyl-3-methyl-5-hydroxy-6-metoxy-1,4-benzoquinol methylase